MGIWQPGRPPGGGMGGYQQQNQSGKKVTVGHLLVIFFIAGEILSPNCGPSAFQSVKMKIAIFRKDGS